MIIKKKISYWVKMCAMLILKYFHPVKQKSNLPDLRGPLSQSLPPTAIAAANIKVSEALNEAEVKKSASMACGTYLFLTSAQKYEIGKRAAKHGVIATICYYAKISRFGTERKLCK